MEVAMKFKKVHKNTLVKGLVLLFSVAMLLFPGASFQGASSGLLLWFHNVLPNLLPFIIISNLLVRLNITKQISRIFHPFLGRLFRISSEGCYPIIMGFLSGIPMGAKSTADMVAENKITRKEGQFLLGMCNNASPMFIIGYIAITQLKLPQINYALFAIIYGSAILSALIYRFFFQRTATMSSVSSLDSLSIKNKKTQSMRFSFDLFDSSIMNGFEIVTKIGGYIILFSILAQIIREIGPETNFIKAFLMGIMEITTGISQICNTELDIKTKIVLVSVITSFGGFSGIAQTKSVLGDTRLSINSYIIVKMISALLSLIFALFYVNLFHVT
jgi:sporulation integral membrane protein YlbJ